MEKMENHMFEPLMIILSKIQMALSSFIGVMVGMLFIVLNESALIMFFAYLFLILNVFSGWLLMWKTKEKWDEEKWFKTCMKFLWFPIIILSTKALELVYGIGFSIGVLVAGILTVNEFGGFMRNVGTLMGIDVWNAIIEKVDWKNTFRVGVEKKKDTP